MLRRRQIIMITCAGVAAVVMVISLTTAKDQEGQTLVTQLFEIAGPPEVQAKEPKKKAVPPARTPTMKAIEGLPSDLSEERDIEELMGKGLPVGLAEPYVGTWTERSVSDESTATLKTTLHRDGTFVLDAVLKPRDPAQRTQRLGASGRWAMDGPDVVLVIDKTDAPETLSIGFVQVFGDSRVSGPDWTYTDTDGSSRTARKR